MNRIPEELAINCVLRTDEAAQFCGVSVSHFRRLYAKGQIPVPVRLGERRLGWRLGDLIDWIKGRRIGQISTHRAGVDQ